VTSRFFLLGSFKAVTIIVVNHLMLFCEQATGLTYILGVLIKVIKLPSEVRRGRDHAKNKSNLGKGQE
jgi:hypothetical protein